MESSAPAKPLHNLDLPNLKWKTGNSSSSTTSNHHHHRRSIKSPSPTPQSPPPLHSVSAPPLRESPKSSPIGAVETKSTPASESIIRICGEEKKSKAATKILIKIPRLNNNTKQDESPPPKILVESNGDHSGLTTDEVIDNIVNEEMKIWNLRPRKPNHKSKESIAINVEKNTNNKPIGEKKKQKKKLSICVSLSKEEIEEDIYSFTGLKPSMRPKKRAKNVQKKMDTLYPGLWLVSITPDSYRVSENSMKG